MLPIAHRGCWFPHADRGNTVLAMQHAVDAGYGVEIDVHRVVRDGTYRTLTNMAIGHDVPSVCEEGWPPHPASFVGVFKDAPVILWNVKTPGLAELLPQFIFSHDLQDKSFIFDHDLPGMPPNYAQDFWDWSPDLKLLCRISDRERGPENLDKYHGVWLDQLDVDWVHNEVIASLHDMGKMVFVVSSELHRRLVNLKMWFKWVAADGICTDHPKLLYELLGGLDIGVKMKTDLFPTDPWWQRPEWLQSVAEARTMSR